jgi:hypothetical protein
MTIVVFKMPPKDFFQIDPSDECRSSSSSSSLNEASSGRGVYQSFQWGEDLQIVELDVRYHASPFLQRQHPSLHEGSDGRVRVQGPYKIDLDTTKTLLGPRQWAWLERQMQVPVRTRRLVSPIQVLAVDLTWDCWNLFPHERKRLLDALSSAVAAANCSQTVILSGDWHVAGFYRLASNENGSPTSNDGLTESTSSSLTHSVPVGLMDETDRNRLGDLIYYANNFGLLDLHRSTGAVTVSIRRSDTGEECRQPYNPMVISPAAASSRQLYQLQYSVAYDAYVPLLFVQGVCLICVRCRRHVTLSGQRGDNRAFLAVHIIGSVKQPNEFLLLYQSNAVGQDLGGLPKVACSFEIVLKHQDSSQRHKLVAMTGSICYCHPNKFCQQRQERFARQIIGVA